MQGTVKSFGKKSGYGFISGDDGKTYFVHYSNIKGTAFRSLSAGQKVSFIPKETQKNPIATEVTVNA